MAVGVKPKYAFYTLILTDLVDQDKSTASRNKNKTKKMALDWSHAEKT